VIGVRWTVKVIGFVQFGGPEVLSVIDAAVIC
jgi:hypothetical protein